MDETHISKNYMAHGGKELVIGGKLTFLPGATVEGLDGLLDVLPAQEPENLPPYFPSSNATTIATLREDFNRLLDVLRSAGILALEEPRPCQEAAHDPDS